MGTVKQLQHQKSKKEYQQDKSEHQKANEWRYQKEQNRTRIHSIFHYHEK